MEIEELFRKFHTPPHVVEHCRTVAKVARFIAEKILQQGIKVDISLVEAAALLHDFVRIVDFRTFEPEKFPYPATAEDIAAWKQLRADYAGVHHAIAGAEILEKLGFSAVATIVRAHRFLQIAEGFHSWEEKIVYYADKRVRYTTVVALKERLADGRRRNAPETIGQKSSEEFDQKVFALEEEVCQAAGIQPEDLH